MIINANVEIDLYDTAMRINYDDFISLVMQVAKAYDDVGFTEELITRLVKSLKGDSTELPFIKWDEIN